MIADLLAKKELIETYLRRRPRQLSTLSFVNLFLWGEEFAYDLQTMDDQLCVFAANGVGTFLYFPPLGKGYTRKTVDRCFGLMQQKNSGRGVSRIENVAEKELSVFSTRDFQVFHKGYEYLYYRPDLAALAGQDYKSKRHDYHVFEKKYSAEYRPFDRAMAGECGELYERWAEHRRQAHREEVFGQMLDDNRRVHQLGMQYLAELGLIGRVVLIDGKIAAYTFGYALTEEIFCVLFEVADLHFRGLPVYIFTEFCRDPEVAPFKFINVMDDFGVKNLEKAKRSFRPAAMIPSYAVSLKKKDPPDA